MGKENRMGKEITMNMNLKNKAFYAFLAANLLFAGTNHAGQGSEQESREHIIDFEINENTKGEKIEFIKTCKLWDVIADSEAATEDKIVSIKELLEQGAQLNKYTANLDTSILSHAIKSKADKAIIELLIDEGAHVNLVDFNKISPITHAINVGHKDALELLLACPEIKFDIKKDKNLLQEIVLCDTALFEYLLNNNELIFKIDRKTLLREFMVQIADLDSFKDNVDHPILYSKIWNTFLIKKIKKELISQTPLNNLNF